MLLVNMNIPEEYQEKAKYCFNILSQIWGIPLRILRKNAQEKPNIVYALNVKQVASDRTVFINFDEEMYNPSTICDIVSVDGLDMWIKHSENIRDADVIAGVYRLITFMDESRVKEEHRDRRGIFNTNALPLSRKKGLQIPLIENHAYYLLRELIRYHPYLKDQSIPRWPNGKKYVISITHDTDAVNLGSSKEILTNLTKAIVRRDKTHFNMFRMGISHASKNKLVTNPLFGFSNWKEYEAPQSIRSCFYLSTVPKTAKIDINDCKSSVTDPNMNWDILKEMVREGWEFGLHASINTKFRTDSFIQAKNILEEKLGAPIYGLRHHYWALDWLRPYITFRKHVNAGFRYDTSIAWRDAPGFRAATCLPFQPFDPVRERPLSIYVLPTCLMDGHIIKDTNNINSSIKQGQDVIRQVKKTGGVAVLDWHTESSCNILAYENYLTILKAILATFINDSEVWFATPYEVIRFWHQRSVVSP